MAALQNSLLSRMRSARIPAANSGKSLNDTCSSASHTQPTATVSNISLFLSNLRLVDLDLLPDWPDINALTFTDKDATQGQKKRIQSVEWALYQLFALWDPEDARNVCHALFPVAGAMPILTARDNRRSSSPSSLPRTSSSPPTYAAPSSGPSTKPRRMGSWEEIPCCERPC